MNDITYWAVYDTYFGVGSQLESALFDLERQCNVIDKDDIKFYKGSEIKVQFKLVELTE